MSGPSAPKSSSDATRSMVSHAGAPEGDAPTHPGLVLLYAPDHEAYPPAFPFRTRELLVGRDPEVDIRILGGAASRHHARIHREGSAWVLEDLKARNGTLVDGRFIHEVALDPRQVIRIGDAFFRFVERDAEQYARYRLDGTVTEAPGAGTARPGPSAGRIVGGYQIQRIAADLRQIARSSLSVLLRGESGTGKEVFAEQLHDWSGRRGPLVAVNCAAIAPTLIESELFGHRKGAFTGADRDRAGHVRAANGGTLFLDEIGDMPLEAQAKLLRVLQAKEVTPLGATTPERVDVRFVCATHQDLERLQDEGRFRRDLFARLNEYPVTLPPLRQRKEDLLLLCTALAARHSQPEVQVTLPFMIGLLHHDFPYNVRELEALIKRWAALARGPALDADALSDAMKRRMETYGARDEPREPAPAPPAASPPAPLAAPPGQPEVQWLPHGAAPTADELRAALARHGGNIAAVARLFGRDRVQIHRWMKRYGIDIDAIR